jgi:hypothetical protein
MPRHQRIEGIPRQHDQPCIRFDHARRRVVAAADQAAAGQDAAFARADPVELQLPTLTHFRNTDRAAQHERKLAARRSGAEERSARRKLHQPGLRQRPGQLIRVEPVQCRIKGLQFFRNSNGRHGCGEATGRVSILRW